MSQANYDKLAAKIKELKMKRAVISKTIGEARDHGDLKENSAYHEAKNEQGLNEMRIKELEAKLNDAEIVAEGNKAPAGEIVLGSTVKIKAVDTNDQFEYTLVSEMEADILENKISPESPVGDALLGQKKGDLIEVQTPRGWVKYKIVEVSR
jgi:transcription elongation factor GreA